MTNIIPIAGFVLLLLFTALLFQSMARYVYNYKIGKTGIEIALFGKIPLKRIPFDNISEIKKTSYKETFFTKSTEMFLALRFGNRIWGEIVLVRQRKGFIKIVLITPDNADGFIQEVLQRLQK
ncbi:MAG: hypothetical protein HQL10_13395 [Nitrospirae bacterium]|nr:hypothetical protein [Nitrospirota bacterium]